MVSDAAVEADGLQHTYATVGPDCIDLVIFLLQPTPEEAQETAARLSRRMLESAESLAGSELVHCSLLPYGKALAAPGDGDDRFLSAQEPDSLPG